MRRALALAVLVACASVAAAEETIRAQIEAALARGDRPAALALLDAVEPADRARSVEAAQAAMKLVHGPDGNLRAARLLVRTLRLDRSDRGGAWTVTMGLRTLAQKREIDLVSAHELFSGLVSIYPETIDYAKDLALVYADGGLADEARAEYAKIIELAPSMTEARYKLESLEEDRGHFEEALAIYDGLIALHAQDARPELRAHVNKGWLLLEKLRDCAAARRALGAGIAAANGAAPGLFRDEYLARFESLRAAIDAEELHRADLRSLRARLDAVLWWTGAIWLAVLGGGVVLLRRAKWI